MKFLKKIPLIKTEDSASDLKFQDHADSNNKITFEESAKTLKIGILCKAKLTKNEGFIQKIIIMEIENYQYTKIHQ